jgi:hypothetical protein
MAGVCHHIQFFSVVMVSCKLFYSGWPGTAIVFISASWVAWDDRCMPLCPDIGWDGVSWTFHLGWSATWSSQSQSPKELVQMWVTSTQLYLKYFYLFILKFIPWITLFSDILGGYNTLMYHRSLMMDIQVVTLFQKAPSWTCSPTDNSYMVMTNNRQQ